MKRCWYIYSTKNSGSTESRKARCTNMSMQMMCALKIMKQYRINALNLQEKLIRMITATQSIQNLTKSHSLIFFSGLIFFFLELGKKRKKKSHHSVYSTMQLALQAFNHSTLETEANRSLSSKPARLHTMSYCLREKKTSEALSHSRLHSDVHGSSM